ncbi:hypothetical protein GW17_00022844 [Ensete ventricosum]|nr:hypothetical protein GW17_00022844 [Ensete ventricosum]
MGTTSSTPAPPIESRSPSEVQEIPVEEATRRAPEERIRGASEDPGKRRAKDPTSQRKKGKGSGRHRFHHETDESKYRMSKAKDLLTPPKRPRSRHAPRNGSDVANARDTDLTGEGILGEIYPRHS